MGFSKPVNLPGVSATGAKSPSLQTVELRRARRFNLAWLVRVRGICRGKREFQETTALENLSATGALFRTARRLKTGRKVEMTIEIPFDKKSCMQYIARIVRVENAHPNLNVAVEFCSTRPCFARGPLEDAPSRSRAANRANGIGKNHSSDSKAADAIETDCLQIEKKQTGDRKS